ncbi:F0F1 ATP synthase subunit B [Pseudofulvimonas gallinarii]|jgi:F-type H+-transporting ATPase subunit b|uniref:ATP synthase subunit b n=1 Tax=Pseudofulvimonas gallinarii TaxID=634155 RepID=A0A4S3KTN9_9GAMM|nr:F0F1 ATP synthase subunit B [Pseudofulvimonas gallinarii]TCS97192.1 F-type H+-transporting ATPase subunit b [Pseudofulvimonas gallinarii]THD12533.1 F0F1 ATP synthase subunit B [Pseudofulvimonas gallinarii]
MNLNLTLIAQALAFAGLIWLIATVVWPPLLKAIEERQQKIAEGLAAADRAKADLAAADQRVEEEIKAARSKAAEILDRAHAQANQILDKAKADALAEAVRQKAAAEAEIGSMLQSARENLRTQLGGLAVLGAEKIVRREIDAAAHRALIEELASEI